MCAVREASRVSVVHRPELSEGAVDVRVRRVGQRRHELRLSGEENEAEERRRGRVATEAHHARDLGRKQHENGEL